MKIDKPQTIVPAETVQSKIYLIRAKKVMVDRDLAEIYGVLTKVLNQAVKRNIERFPEDFMFQLSKEETENWKSQIVTSNREKMGIRRRPYVFTEQGVAMLSSVLNSKRAIQVNIQIMRTFVKMKELISMHKNIYNQLNKIELKLMKHNKDIVKIFDVIKEIMKTPVRNKSNRNAIGFKPPTKNNG